MMPAPRGGLMLMTTQLGRLHHATAVSWGRASPLGRTHAAFDHHGRDGPRARLGYRGCRLSVIGT